MTTSPARRKRVTLPLFEGLLPFSMSTLPTAMIAGATLAALAIPEVMGYTKIAGTPVITGLYTLLLPVVAFAILGSSRHLVVGADSATAAIMATGLAGLAAVGSPQYVELASLAALLCGLLLVIARLLRLGFVANFLSRSVLVGFLTGVGVQVALGEVGGMFGITGVGGSTIQKFVDTISRIPTQTSVITLVVSIGVLLVIVVLERVNKAIPGALIAVVGAIAVSFAFDLQAHGLSVLGAVPGGLPALGLPLDVMTASNVIAVFPTVVPMVVVILAQSAATSRAYAMKYSDSFDENVDLIGLGVANAAAAVTGTFVVNGSPTKTAMVDGAGGRSQVSQLTTGAIVVAVLLFLTGPLAYMPEAVLAAVVFLIGVRLVDAHGMADILRVRRGEFAVALATAVTVVVLGVEQGIVLAMTLSIVEHIHHSYRPYDTLIVETPAGRSAIVPLESGSQLAPGLAVYRFGSGLYYANAGRFTDEIMRLVEGAQPPLAWVGLSAASMGDVDYSGSDTLRAVHEELGRKGITLAFADVSPRVRAQLDAYGLTSRIGQERLYDSVAELVAAYRARAQASSGSVPEPPGAAGPRPEPPGADAPTAG